MKSRLLLPSIALLYFLCYFNPGLSQTSFDYDLRSFMLEFNSPPDTSNWYCETYLVTGLPSLDSLNTEYGVNSYYPMFRILQYRPFNKYYIFKTRQDVARMDQLIQEYESDINITWTEYNYKLIFCYIPNDPERNSNAFGNLVGIDLYRGFDLEMGQSDVVVGVIDNGMSYTITELAYSLSQHNYWVNPGEDLDGDGVLFDEDDINGDDDDENGLIDDFHGWNFTNNSNSLTEASHGTMIGSAIAAYADNEQGIIGVAGGKWSDYTGVKLLPMQGNSLGYMPSAIEYGMQYCDVINMSFVVSPNVNFYIDEDFPVWVPLMEEVQAHDCLLIAGAGNSPPLPVQDHVYAPANSDYVIAVTSTYHNDQHEIILASDFACYGPEITICAPGVDIPLVNASGYVSEQSGTSVSTAIVSGIAALLKSYNSNLGYQDLWDLLVNNAENIDASNPGYENMLGAGQVKAYYSLSAVYPPNVPGNFQLEIINNHPHLTWESSDPDVEMYEIWRKVSNRGNVLEPWGIHAQVNGSTNEYTDDMFGYSPTGPWYAYYKIRAQDAAGLYSNYTSILSTQGYPGIENTAQFNLSLLSQTSLGGLGGGLAKLNDYLYVNIGAVGLITYDVSNPANPVLTDFIPGWNEVITGLEIDRGYLFAPGDGHLSAYEISDPAHPLPTSANYGAGNWGTSLYSMDNYIIKTFLNTIAPFEDILIELCDAENILNPQIVWEYYGTGSADHSVFDYNNKVLYTGATFMVDFNDSTSPVVVEYEGYGTPLSLDDNNLWCQIFSQTSDNKLVCYDRNDPYNLTAIDTVAMPLLLTSLYIYNDFAVGLDGNLHLFDISDRFNWIQLDSVSLLNDLFFQLGSENFIYATTNDSLFIFSIESNSGIIESQTSLYPIEYLHVECYPNPFNPQTTVKFFLPEAGKIEITAYDILGREVAVIARGYFWAGEHSITWKPSNCISSSIYFIKLDAKDRKYVTRTLLLR